MKSTASITAIMLIALGLGVTAAPPADATVDCSLTTWPVATETDLADAVACFNAETGAGTYTVEVTGDITYTGVLPTITNTTAGVSLTIQGYGHTLDADGNGSVLTIIDANVTVDHTTITGGNANRGGGVYIDLSSSGFDVAINQSTITGNTATVLDPNVILAGSGGGIYGSGGYVVVSASTINANTAADGGGGIYLQYGEVVNSTISGNTATNRGGGVLGGSSNQLGFNTITNTRHHRAQAGSRAAASPKETSLLATTDPTLAAASCSATGATFGAPVPQAKPSQTTCSTSHRPRSRSAPSPTTADPPTPTPCSTAPSPSTTSQP